MQVSVIIVSYETRDLLRKCLTTVYTQTDPSLNFEVIVVDNASTDGSVDMLRNEFPDVRLVVSDENLGFGRACNLGSEIATGDYICLLNPDAEVVGDTLGSLHRFAVAHPAAGMWGGRSLNRDGTLDPKSCWALPTMWSTFTFATGLSTVFRNSTTFNPEAMPDWKRDSVRHVDVVTGYLMMIHRSTWDRVGGFDERFFLYGEDADLGARLRDAGYSPLITPDATVIHVGGAASKTHARKLMWLLKGKTTYARKHWSGPRQRVVLGLLTAGVGVRAFAASLRSRRQVVVDPPAWVSIWDQRKEWQAGYPTPERATQPTKS